MELYIGLMSGTSIDGVDAVLVDFESNIPTILGTYYQPYSSDLRSRITALCSPGENEVERTAQVDILLGAVFADTVKKLLQKVNRSAKSIKAIGSHGQTIRHHPHDRFTVQIGDPNTIAAQTGITTIADFRRKDIALGGQGAPLVPAFHHYFFNLKRYPHRAIINIGGIANMTITLNSQLIGFDTGPGNTLLDAWIHQKLGKTFDENGKWAETGQVIEELLYALLADPYFQKLPPKSTGREYFNLNWLQSYLLNTNYASCDIQATLLELTAQSIMLALKQFMQTGELLVCGGGAYNTFLLQRLSVLANSLFLVNSTEYYGIAPDWVEAVAFAWLARQTLNRLPGNIPAVTGAKEAVILGGVYFA